MAWFELHQVLVIIQRSISFIGVLVIFSGVLYALFQYLSYILTHHTKKSEKTVNTIRLKLGRVLILGLEFIVAADLIGTTTAPDYYSVGILAIIVVIRTLLSFTLNREIVALSKEN